MLRTRLACMAVCGGRSGPTQRRDDGSWDRYEPADVVSLAEMSMVG